MIIAAPPSSLQMEDYEEIETAVMETARGRWFLAEYARRVRGAEGERLLAAIARVEARLEAQGALAPEETFSVAERLSELSWMLRERGVEDFVCGKIDALAKEISGGVKAAPRRTAEKTQIDLRREEPPIAPPARASDPAEDARRAVGAIEPSTIAAAQVAIQELARSPPEADFAATVPEAPALTPTPAPETARALEPAHAAGDAAREPEPALPIDPRLAALSWLDRLPLVDRMALFA